MTLQKDQTSDFLLKFRQGRINRRQLLHSLTLIGALGAANGLVPGLGLISSARAQGKTPKRGGTLTAATIDKPVNMDPAFAELYSSMQVYQNVFNKLVYAQRDGTLAPGLAKSWRQVDDKTWEFELVDNAWFHNDEKFTGADVKYTFDRLADPKLGAANHVFVQPLESVEVVSDTKVLFHTKPNWGGLLLALAAIGEIVNKKAIETNDPKLMPIGTGPFKFVEWVKDDHITLERWDKYFKPGQPYLDKLIFRAIADDTQRLNGLQTGEYGWIEQVPLHRVAELKQNPELKANPGGQFFPDIFLLNTTKPPFDNVAVRQAMQWAMPRKAIANVVWHGQAVPSLEPVSPSNVWYSGVDTYSGAPDLAKAREALQKAGIDTLDISFASQPQVPTQPLVGQLMQQQLRQIGINMQVESFESARWFEELTTKRYQMTGTYWSVTLDPVGHCLGPLSRSGSAWNFSGFDQSPELDAAIDSFNFTVDPEARKKSYATLMKLHEELAPMIFQVNFDRTYWTHPNVYGVETLPSLELRMEDVWIDA
ncbi:ABC transporter substrate-binding protein [Mesorhizobium sp. BR1-1-16]|uniref:ABC transporter substrate-binding protein n=1 Tax=Mesorhizobium sp. BR1-1-16 TaxID=2876653 RepID=UPI001CCA7C32|nr:ABC transporter substrate-binding protein [Mesorhizobium sp. BR1-1-16]MBZ9935630.1 ABC transporter substrate-binding protein [Mesorhizobium sp. BR1-1-16]